MHLRIIQFITDDFVKSLDPNDLVSEKMEALKKKLVNSRTECGEDFAEFDSFFKDLMRANKIADECGLRIKMTNQMAKCFTKALAHFKGDIETQTLKVMTEFVSKSAIDNDDQQSNKLGMPSAAMTNMNKLAKLKEEFSVMPPCLEKHVLSLIFHLNLKCLDKTQSVGELFDSSTYDADMKSDEDICRLFDALNERLNIERPACTLSVEDMRNEFRSREFSSVIRELDKLLKSIRLLNIPEMRDLTEKAKSAAKRIKDKDVILLLGETGTGKSTTIHFLAGSKMASTCVDIGKGVSLRHIAPVKPYHIQALYNVSVSSRAESETRYINVVPVNLSEFKNSTSKRILYLCDTPGFGDTAGAEVEIANSLGVLEAISGCQSVKPVVLISYLMIGDRGQGIRKLAHLLLRMVPDIADKLESFSYIFTKFPEHVDIYACLLNIKSTSVDRNSAENDGDEDDAFNALFDHILERAEACAKNLDPLSDKPLAVIKNLLASAKIQNPQEAFRYSITEQSRNALNEQVREHQMCIVNAAKRGEYALIKYKLGELLFLKQTLREEFIESILNDCIKYVSCHINEQFAESEAAFDRCLDSELKSTDVTQYGNQVEKQKEAECLNELKMAENSIG